MATIFSKQSVVHGHHIYKVAWTLFIGEILDARREDENSLDRHAVAVVFDSCIVHHNGQQRYHANSPTAQDISKNKTGKLDIHARTINEPHLSKRNRRTCYAKYIQCIVQHTNWPLPNFN